MVGLEQVGAGVAAATAFAAAVAAFEQILIPARLRRRSEWARQAADVESDPQRKAVLERLAARDTARLVAARYVPIYLFTELAVMFVLTGGLVARSAESGLGPIANVIGTAVLLVWTPVRRAIRLYCERARIVDAYLDGSDTIPPPNLDLLSLMEGGTRIEFLYASVGALGFGLLVLAPVLFAHELELAAVVCVMSAGTLALSVIGWLRRRLKTRPL